ncbi:hypothetical protein KIM372_12920 [Bombiscardovia nodaiensis]|uniref:DUF3800 domain-containing protein n=1 Tax=Bombiscardovia nodaiensis TaxID=2932181 RepID=A0ABM8B920_9BIFI|nr:hypothetical protein KIM372_12920 [Bombiscardovia nodaiensis]
MSNLIAYNKSASLSNEEGSKSRGHSPGIFFLSSGVPMSELSIMVDESGEWGKMSKYYLITLVFHEQDCPIEEAIQHYEQHLTDSSLPDIPFHTGPLLNGHDDYETLSMEQRKKLLIAFFMLAQSMPFTYVTFIHEKSEFHNNKARFEAKLKQDLADFLFLHLEKFQSFETIKVYYDNGQNVVSNALRDSIGYALSKEAVIYKNTSPEKYRLIQVADFLCTLELTAEKFDAKEATATDIKIFQSRQIFRKNYLKKIRKKRML